MDNSVYLELNRDFDSTDLDIISLFFENKKQSDGGDITSITQLDGQNVIKVTFEENDTKNRVLRKKFFSFKSYLIRSSENGLKNEAYELNEFDLILSNIDSNEDPFVVQLYAESLQPDNEVIQVVNSLSFSDTWFIQFKDKICPDTLAKRLAKKPLFRSQIVQLINSHKTNTLIFLSQNETFDKQMLHEKINEKLESINSSKYFNQEISSNCVIYQFPIEINLSVLKQSLKSVVNLNELIIECCSNFTLLNLIQTKLNTKKVSEVKEVLEVKRVLDVKHKSNQTDNPKKKSIQIQTDSKFLDEQVTNEPVPVKKVDSGTSLSSAANKPSNVNKQLESNDSNQLPKVVLNQTNEDNSILTLDPNQFYTIGLLNARQLGECFEAYLKQSLDKNLIVLAQNNSVIIKHLNPDLNPTWKSKMANEINKFFNNKAEFKTAKIPNEILNNSSKLNQFNEYLANLNKSYNCIHLRIVNNQVHTYGTKKFLAKKYGSLVDLMNKLSKDTPKQAAILQTDGKNDIKTQANDANEKNGKVLNDNRIKLDIYPVLNMSIRNIKFIHDHLNLHLRNLNAIIILDDSGYWVMHTSSTGTDDLNAWRTNAATFLNAYETGSLLNKKIKMPQLLKEQPGQDQKEIISNFKKQIEELYILNEFIGTKFEITPEQITVYGHKDSVNEFVLNINSRISKIEQDLKDKLNEKLSFKLTPSKGNVLSIFTSNVTYFKEFTELIKKFDATMEKLNDQVGFNIKYQNFNGSSQAPKNINEWRKKVDLFIKNYFSLFNCRRVSTSFKRDEASSRLTSFGDKIKIVWIDSKTVELTGLNSEIDKAIKCLASNEPVLNNSSNKNSTVSKSNGTTNLASNFNQEPKESFVISDLKWFQTHILFEKKYFKSMSENFKDLSVLVDTQMTRIIYNGTKQDIQKAKDIAFEILESIMGTEVDAKTELLQKLNSNETTLTDFIKQNGLGCCIVDAKSSTSKYTIYGTNYDEIEKCKYLLAGLKL